LSAKSTLKDNLARVRERMAAAAGRSRRDPGEVRLIAVTKGALLPAVLEAIALGELDLGESRVQDLLPRATQVGQILARQSAGTPTVVRWHMIGHLQRNKVRPLLPLVQMVHSVDTLRLAETIDQAARKAALVAPVLLEVNCSGEGQKHGVAVGAAGYLAEQLATLGGLELRGLMTLAEQTDRAEETRPVFARLREVFQDIVEAGKVSAAFRELSMGMSQDFEVAIEEGATMVRIGTAIFGLRHGEAGLRPGEVG
jgi:hypothetical protein